MHPPDPHTPPGPRRVLLYCSVCRDTVRCDPADLMRCVRAGWPRCCDEVMALLTEDAEGDENPDDRTGYGEPPTEGNEDGQ
jgi:hypothetical protein